MSHKPNSPLPPSPASRSIQLLPQSSSSQNLSEAFPSTSNGAETSTKPTIPSPFTDCTHLLTRRFDNGLAHEQKPHRYNNGPPVFGSNAAYEATRTPLREKSGWIYTCVKLDPALTAEEYEAHYHRVWELCKKAEERGFKGTGIVMDCCGSASGYRAYMAVFDAVTLEEVRGDSVVLRANIHNSLASKGKIKRVGVE